MKRTAIPRKGGPRPPLLTLPTCGTHATSVAARSRRSSRGLRWIGPLCRIMEWRSHSSTRIPDGFSGKFSHEPRTSSSIMLLPSTRSNIPLFTLLPFFIPVCLLPLHAQTEYIFDGSPTPLEEEIRWLSNRARFDTAAENALRGTSYDNVPATAGPLAPHRSLAAAARNHSQDMATLNVVQHQTIPGSAFYNHITHPGPEHRMSAEGYAWNAVAENLSAGRPSAEAAYTAWWNSSGHRVNLTRATLREIGCGHAFNASSTYGRYYTMKLGNSGNTHFFTGTLFLDSNNNGKYDQGEGLPALEVTLLVDDSPFEHFDRSSAAGAFAIPLQSISPNASVAVVIRNPSPASVSLTIPRTYHDHTTIEIPAGGTWIAGTFVKAAAAENIGFRNLVGWTEQEDDLPTLTLRIETGDAVVTWLSRAGLSYMPQYSTDLLQWDDLADEPLPGTGAELSWTHQDALVEEPVGFYRLVITGND